MTTTPQEPDPSVIPPAGPDDPIPGGPDDPIPGGDPEHPFPGSTPGAGEPLPD